MARRSLAVPTSGAQPIRWRPVSSLAERFDSVLVPQEYCSFSCLDIGSGERHGGITRW